MNEVEFLTVKTKELHFLVNYELCFTIFISICHCIAIDLFIPKFNTIIFLNLSHYLLCNLWNVDNISDVYKMVVLVCLLFAFIFIVFIAKMIISCYSSVFYDFPFIGVDWILNGNLHYWDVPRLPVQQWIVQNCCLLVKNNSITICYLWLRNEKKTAKKQSQIWCESNLGIFVWIKSNRKTFYKYSYIYISTATTTVIL